jgi:hypothetical protein
MDFRLPADLVNWQQRCATVELNSSPMTTRSSARGSFPRTSGAGSRSRALRGQHRARRWSRFVHAGRCHLATEELAKARGPSTTCPGSTCISGRESIELGGSEEQKQRLAARARQDASSPRWPSPSPRSAPAPRASPPRRAGGGDVYVLNGQKITSPMPRKPECSRCSPRSIPGAGGADHRLPRRGGDAGPHEWDGPSRWRRAAGLPLRGDPA